MEHIMCENRWWRATGRGTRTERLLQHLGTKPGQQRLEPTWMMLPGADLFVAVPFHAVHTMLEKDEEKMGFESKKLQSLVKEKTFFLSELGPLADCIPPGVIRSLVALKDKP
ncbi:unnamed protein product [Brassica oleracea]|uniref:Uncharacterized protein n=3 Tax=Brassica TaxID=3705 RepID=A0A0D3CPW0_BRAOL|nr:unnamed protein product [Brassica napus]VDD60276.1 unnamed protein product [Brassica oleracea]